MAFKINKEVAALCTAFWVRGPEGGFDNGSFYGIKKQHHFQILSILLIKLNKRVLNKISIKKGVARYIQVIKIIGIYSQISNLMFWGMFCHFLYFAGVYML